MDYVTQDFQSAKGYLISVLRPENINLDGDEHTAIEVDVTQALTAINAVLDDAYRHGQQSFKAGFETGRQQILSCLSPDLRAEVEGSIDIETLAAMEKVKSDKAVDLICTRCGTKFSSPEIARCPKCHQSE